MNEPLSREHVARAPQPFKLPALPWAKDALEPVISRRTIELHHGKHHAAYVKKLNELVAGTELERLSLHDIVVRTARDGERKEIFDNAGQALNHAFYWDCLKPGAKKPPQQVRQLLDRDLGGYDAFVKDFVEAATAQFGSGWAWLVLNGGKLEIRTTSNAQTPVVDGATPLLTVDVWEHAYYLDYQNERPKHVKAVVQKLLNWEFAAENLARV
jgi:Fe-Mn family superoxide dismutase